MMKEGEAADEAFHQALYNYKIEYLHFLIFLRKVL